MASAMPEREVKSAAPTHTVGWLDMAVIKAFSEASWIRKLLFEISVKL
jgi:hypothetical protein